MTTSWTQTDEEIIAEQRALAIDILAKAGSGHPGATLALMPLLYALYTKVLRHNPAVPDWDARDRLVLSCGHASLALYIQLHYAGYPISISDLYEFRSFGSITPGHPEMNQCLGVEATTGPLGQGFAMSVGIALAEAMRADGEEKTNRFRKQVFSVVSDGDMQEGISFEAASIAARYGLGNLTVFYDFNEITIDGSLSLSSVVNFEQYFSSLNWNVRKVKKLPNEDIDVKTILAAIHEDKSSDRPRLIIVESTLGFPAVSSRGKARIHGTLMSQEESKRTKDLLGYGHVEKVEPSVRLIEYTREQINERVQALDGCTEYKKAVTSLPVHQLMSALSELEFENGISMRKANAIILERLKSEYPWVIGGSADLTESNSLRLKNLYGALEDKNVRGNTPNTQLTFGIREHAMAAVTNGVALDGSNLAFCATYLAFSDYQKPAVRLSALMKIPIVYVWTHDSVAIGADGPTHQPVEQLAMLRSIPNFSIVRPATSDELKAAWARFLQDRLPIGLALSRQEIDLIQEYRFKVGTELDKGAYIFYENYEAGNPDVIVIATGSEVRLAVQASKNSRLDHLKIRIVSMPCQSWFDSQSELYKEKVLPSSTKHILVVEAAASYGWHKYARGSDAIIGIDSFGLSGDGLTVLSHFGIDEQSIVQFILSKVEVGYSR